MPQHSEISVLITPNISSPGEADHVISRLLSSLGGTGFWGRGPLVWNLSDAELRDCGPSHALQARLNAGDLCAPAGYSKAPHSLLSPEELGTELGTTGCAVIPPRCDTERREVEVTYRALAVPLILGRRTLREGEQLIGYRNGMLSTAPLLRMLPLIGEQRSSPWHMRRLSRRILRYAARHGRYLVLHAVVTDEDSVDQLISFFRSTGTVASFTARVSLSGLRLPNSADPKVEETITPLYTPAADPLEPARLYRMLALRDSAAPRSSRAARLTGTGATLDPRGVDSSSEARLKHNVLETWLSVSKTPGNHRAKGNTHASSRYQVVASMQGESSLTEGELELRCTEGAPTEIRVAGQTMLQGVLPIARFSSGSQGISLEPRGVVSIESEFARGLSARFAFPEDDLATSRLSLRYLFFEGVPELFIELELDLKPPAGFAAKHSFTCLSFRPASGAVVYATHPLQKRSGAVLDYRIPHFTGAAPRSEVAASLRIETTTAALGVGALPPVADGRSALLYTTNSQLSLGPSYGPTQTEFVDGLLDRRVLIFSTTRPGRSSASSVSTTVRSQLHDPVCFLG